MNATIHLTILFSFILTLCVASQAQANRWLETIKICHEPHHNPPYYYKGEQKPKGLLIDLLQEAAEQSNISIELYENSWNRCQKDVAEGRAQALFPMVKTEKREQAYAFPPPQKHYSWYMWLAQYPIFTPTNTEFSFHTYRPDKGIGAPIGYVVWDNLKRLGWLSHYRHEPQEGLSLVANNKLDGYVVEKLIGLELIKDHELQTRVEMNHFTFLETGWYVPFNQQFYTRHQTLVHRFWQMLAITRQGFESRQ